MGEINILIIKGRNSNSLLCNDGLFHDWSHACDGLLETCRFKCKECNPARAFQCHSLQSIQNNGNGTNVSDKMFPECIHRSLVFLLYCQLFLRS